MTSDTISVNEVLYAVLLLYLLQMSQQWTVIGNNSERTSYKELMKSLQTISRLILLPIVHFQVTPALVCVIVAINAHVVH